MKSLQLLSTAFVLLLATTAFAQDFPDKEFTISLSEKDIVLVPGETKRIEVTINRSKAFSKTDIDLSLSSILPEGILVDFENGPDPAVNQIMVISAATDTAPFKKAIILKAYSSRATKGIMLNMSLDTQVLSAN